MSSAIGKYFAGFGVGLVLGTGAFFLKQEEEVLIKDFGQFHFMPVTVIRSRFAPSQQVLIFV